MGVTFLDTLCREDDPLVESTMYNEYWYLMNIVCLYLKLDSPKWRLISCVQFLATCFLLIYFMIIMAVTAIKLKDNLMGLCQCMHYSILLLLILTMLTTINRCRPNMARIHRGMGTGLSEYDLETEQNRVTLRQRIRKYQVLLIKIYFFYLIAGIVLLGVLVILTQDSDDSDDELYIANAISLDLPIPQWSPFVTDSPLKLFIAVGLQIIICTVVSIVNIGLNILYLTIALNLTMELDLLIISLGTLSQRALQMYQLRHGAEASRHESINGIRENQELARCYSDCLKQNVRHHQRTIEMFNDLSAIVSVLLFLALSTGGFYTAISGALIMFAQGSVAARVASGAFCCAEIANIFFHCWCAEQIIERSARLSRALYATKWTLANKDSARTVLIMLTRANLPLVMTCKNLIKINFETFGNIMNSAYSFFNLLNAVEEEL